MSRSWARADRTIAALLATATLATGCASMTMAPRSNDPAAVIGKTWQWEEMVTPVERIAVPNPERYTVELAPDGKIAARFDCNRGGGVYQISEGKLAFGPMASTRAACPQGSLDTRFARDLGRVTSFFVENGKLYLELPVDSGTMRFRPAP